jgi:hypothetical protein
MKCTHAPIFYVDIDRYTGGYTGGSARVIVWWMLTVPRCAIICFLHPSAICEMQHSAAWRYFQSGCSTACTCIHHDACNGSVRSLPTHFGTKILRLRASDFSTNREFEEASTGGAQVVEFICLRGRERGYAQKEGTRSWRKARLKTVLPPSDRASLSRQSLPTSTACTSFNFSSNKQIMFKFKKT